MLTPNFTFYRVLYTFHMTNNTFLHTDTHTQNLFQQKLHIPEHIPIETLLFIKEKVFIEFKFSHKALFM